MPANSMDKIDHIVYVMFENRAFDSVLGWLYDSSGTPQTRPLHNLPEQSPTTYHGLHEKTYYNLDRHNKKHFVTKGTGKSTCIPWHDPYEEYQHVNNQLFDAGKANPPANARPSMGGFFKDYDVDLDKAAQILQTYDIGDLPVLNGLAHGFAVSDAYFSSVPTQTNCNRAFAGAGNSLGYKEGSNTLEAWVNNHWGGSIIHPESLSVRFTQPTIWNVLSGSARPNPQDWRIYYHELWEKYCFTREMFVRIQGSEFDRNFNPIGQFFDDIKNNVLPRFSFLEPEWLGAITNGNDYHPPGNVAPGEQFLNKIYEKLRAKPDVWNKTLLIINFDEHGGTYDHFPPPWGAPVPWADPDDGTPTPGKCELGFGFDRYGVRVPLILVCPYVPQGLVFRPAGFEVDGKDPRPLTALPYDHCSVIATVLQHFGIPKEQWQLGTRVKSAPTFEGALSLDSPRVSDLPSLTPPTERCPDDVSEAPYHALQEGIACQLLDYAIRQGVSEEALEAAYRRHFGEHVRTAAQLRQALLSTLREAVAAGSGAPDQGGIAGGPSKGGEAPKGLGRWWKKFLRWLVQLLGRK